MPTSTQLIKTLRTTTGAGIMACKKALQAANGNLQAAQDLLRKKNLSISAKRADRATTHGLVFVASNSTHTTAISFTLRCETDFVATTDAFTQLGNTISEQALAHKPHTLQDLKSLNYQDTSIAATITAAIGHIGEKIVLDDYAILEGPCVTTYQHFDKSLGVLLQLNQAPTPDILAAGKVITMQIAAMNPTYISDTHIPKTILEQARETALENARSKNIPDAKLDMVVNSQLKKWHKEVTLLGQPLSKIIK